MGGSTLLPEVFNKDLSEDKPTTARGDTFERSDIAHHFTSSVIFEACKLMLRNIKKAVLYQSQKGLFKFQDG